MTTRTVVHTPLGEAADVIRGVTFRKQDATNFPAPDRMPVLRAGNIRKDLDLENDLVWIPSHLVSPSQYIQRGDIVMCASSGSSAVVGKSAPLRQKWNGTIGAFCTVIRTKLVSCDPDFLAFFLGSPNFRQWTQNAPGANIKNIRKSDLEQFRIPLPPLNEQRRIVNILNRSAKIERLRKQAQERLQEFIPALFIKMFGDPAENPMGWTCSPLGEVCDIVGGGTPSRKIPLYWNGDIPWATVKDFRSHRISHTTEFISRQGLDHSASKVVPSGTVLLVTRVGLGKVAMAGVDLAINQDIKAITPCDDVLPEFLLWCLKHLSPEIERKGTGATVKGVTLKDIKDMPIPIPPTDTQHHFASLTARANSNLTTATTAQSTTTALSTSLMSHLLEPGS